MTTDPDRRVPPDRRILVLYDGVCGLCNRLNRFLLARDRHGWFDFAPLQSDTGRAWLARTGLAGAAPDTLVVVADYRSPSPRPLTRSDAVLVLLPSLGGHWRAAALLRAIPRPIRDAAYALVARHRYAIFGRFESCPLPPAGSRARFIDS
jgi:predicted DCC family thiol-disulfide oxidoreductase YuxK